MYIRICIKRCIALLIAGLLCVGLTSCGEEISPSMAFSQSEEQTDTAELEFGSGLEEPVAIGQLDPNPDRGIRRSVKPAKQSVGTRYDGANLSNKVYFYRSTLNGNQLQAYDLIRAGLLVGKQNIPITVPISPTDIANVYNMVVYDSPELFWAETNMGYSYNNYGNVTSVTPNYNDLVNDIEGNTAQLEEAVAFALGSMWSLGSDVEKAKYAHDYLTNTITYELNSPYNQNIYSSLVLGRSVCAGYAHAFQYLMQKMGIPCAYILGYATDYHAWNLVYLHGEYYAMDVTWDDPLGNPPTQYYYSYFNITDSQMGVDHQRQAPSTSLPWAYGTACSFANAFGGTAYGTDFYGIQPVDPPYDDTDEEELPSEDSEDEEVELPSEDSDDEEVELPSEDSTEEETSSEDNSGDHETEDSSYEDYDDSDTQYEEDIPEEDDSYFDEDLSENWWNLLDSDWSKSDWTYEDDVWQIWDEETQCMYFYDEDSGEFACMDICDEAIYFLDFDSGEWILYE